MKKGILILLILAFTLKGAWAQWEFAYFSLNAGGVHNLLGPKPDGVISKFVNTPDGYYQAFLKTDDKSNNYVPYGLGYHAGLNFHYDLKSNKFGIVVGAEYFTNVLKAKYVTLSEYTLTEKYTTYSLGIPLYVKIGKNIFKQQKYMVFGFQYNYNLDLKQTQSVSGGSESVRWRTPVEFQKSNTMYFVGFNYLVFRAHLYYMPGSYFNKDFMDNRNIPVYQHQRDNYFLLTTSLVVPINDWVFLNSWFAEQVRRRLRQGG